jgi:hypothetical protein
MNIDQNPQSYKTYLEMSISSQEAFVISNSIAFENGYSMNILKTKIISNIYLQTKKDENLLL